MAADRRLARAHHQRFEMASQPRQIEPAKVSTRRQLAGDREPHDPAERRQLGGDLLAYLIGVGGALDPDQDVMPRARRDGEHLLRNGPVLADAEQHRAPLALLSERQGLRVTRIRVPPAKHGPMEVADQRVREPGCGNLIGRERRVRHFAGPLPLETGTLRTMKKCDRDPAPIHPESIQEPVGIRRSAVSRTPDRETISQRKRLQPILTKDHDLARPRDLPVEAGRAVPVVISGGEQHRARHRGEHRPQEFAGVGRRPFVLVQIAGEAKGIDAQLLRELGDATHGIAQRPPPGPRHHGLGPHERRIQMYVGGEQQSDGGHGRTVASWSDKNTPTAYPEPMTVRVTGLDHLVLRVMDVERSLAFYQGVLGLPGVHIEEWRKGETFFPSVRVNDDVIIDLLAAPAGHDGAGSVTNVDHFCLVVDPIDWDAVVTQGIFEVVDGPATRYGAHGDAQSLYVRDPDGNVVELRYYPPE
jgi:catechol 2,3-dioxygenase-like lactoylglutathione lyase family enzyme